MMKNSSHRIIGIFTIALVIAVLSLVPALAKTKPKVAIIKAEWCQACQKLDPTMTELMKQYGDKLDFVVLDVTDDKKTAQAAATAKNLGLSKFFEENKKMTSTVAVFAKGDKPFFVTTKNFDREAYVRAFDEALAKTMDHGMDKGMMDKSMDKKMGKKM